MLESEFISKPRFEGSFFEFPWGKTKNLNIHSFDVHTQECLRNGDGIHDHYGGRTRFVFFKAQKTRSLILELQAENHENVHGWQAVNATGGYGAGMWAGAYEDLAPIVLNALSSATNANDEYHSVDRLQLVNIIRQLIAEHTRTESSLWNMTFTTSGTEAVDFALQQVLLEGYSLATGIDQRKEKNVIIACRGAWHGWSMATTQLLDRRQFTEGLPRLSSVEVIFMPYGNLQATHEIFEQYKGRIRGVFVEGILGDGGIIEGSLSWWKELRALCNQEDCRLVIDEILTCFKTGSFLSFPEGLSPDCITLGKSLGLGLFPLSAVAWMNPKLTPRPGVGVRTFNARPFQSKIIVKALEEFILNDEFSKIQAKGEKLLSQLRSLPTSFPQVFKSTRGRGLLIGMELAMPFARKGRKVRDYLLRCGVITEVESGQFSRHLPQHLRVNETIRITPPFSISDEDIQCIIKAFFKAGQQLTEEIEYGKNENN